MQKMHNAIFSYNNWRDQSPINSLYVTHNHQITFTTSHMWDDCPSDKNLAFKLAVESKFIYLFYLLK